MSAHLYLVLSTYVPLTLDKSETAAKPDVKQSSATLLIKLFNRALTPEENVSVIPSNAGSIGLGTFVIGNKFFYLKNPSRPEPDADYPQIEAINALAETLSNELNLDDPKLTSIYDFATRAASINNVVVHP